MEARRASEPAPRTARRGPAAPGSVGDRGVGPERPRKLSFAERKEWEALPGRIEALEAELETLHARMGGPDFFRSAPEAIRMATERSQEIPEEIERAFARWAELDERA